MKKIYTVFVFIALSVFLLLQVSCSTWAGMINLMMPADSRPYTVKYTTKKVTPKQFDEIATELQKNYDLEFNHIARFKKAHILEYKGPETCLTCHKEITVKDHLTKKDKKVDLMQNLLSSAHFKFFTDKHPNVYGFNGKLADNFPMGKIDRPCPKPGSFAISAWAEIVVNQRGDTLSEGCGQCHIGGEYQAPLGALMPGYHVLDKEKETIDCLICHAAAYDMNQKIVIQDKNGSRWGQDRSMKAAMSVTNTTSQTCLRCHQHNFGGDVYVDSADPSFMQSQTHTGHVRPRVLHPGSKRGTPFSPTWDVHAANGVNCTDCHYTEGHLIAKGTHTTTMMTNDLPDVEVKCEDCHTTKPHQENAKLDGYLNKHIKRIACTTCHIPSLHPDNATMRDFSKTVYEEKAGIYIYDDIRKEYLPGKGIDYVWWDGDATFLGNPIGDNPNGKNLYRFYRPTHIWPEYKNYDYKGWYERVMRPIAKKKPSKLYAMKFFNGRQHVDLQNMGPFGGMFVPYNLPTYYRTGNPDSATVIEMKKSMMKMMYGFLFDKYLMDKFISFMDVDNWDTGAYDDIIHHRKVEPRWIPMDARLEISHAIRREGALTCNDCHSTKGILDWKTLGYTTQEIERFTKNPLKQD